MSIGPNLCSKLLQKDKKSNKSTQCQTQFGSRSCCTLCRARSGFKLFAKEKTVLTNSPRYTVNVQKI